MTETSWQERFDKLFPKEDFGSIHDDLKTFITEVEAAAWNAALATVEEKAKGKQFGHGRLHGTIDCEPCAYADILSLINSLKKQS